MQNDFVDIEGYPGYQINKSGEVKRLAFVQSNGSLRRSRFLKRFYNHGNTERPLVQLKKENRPVFVPLADIMAETFLAVNWQNDYVLRFRDLNSNNVEASNIYLYPKPLDVFERRQEAEALRLATALS